MDDHNRRYGVLASLPGYTVEHPSCCKAQAQSDIPCQTSDLSKDTLIPQGFSWFLTLLQMTMLDMMGWLFYHDFSDNSWPWQGFRIRNLTNALTMRLGLSREKITLLESRLSTIHTQFRFTTHRKAAASQGKRVSTLSSPHLHYWVASANTTHQSREIERLAKGNGILRVCQPVGLDFYQIHRASPGTAELLHETAQHPIWVYPNRYMPHQGLFESRQHHWCEMYHGKW